ncbi:MAG TPA: DNA gyrase inhibitor YacG [Bauldia sp.]|nr:DNA gyrase inhibitor YacG [Bauldia sp.]
MARARKREGDKVVPLRAARACPICGQPSARPTWPFCSRRCADVDLNRWLSGAYAIPAAEDPAGEEGEPAA